MLFDPTDQIRGHQELPCRPRGTDGEEKIKSWSPAPSPAMSDCEGLPTGECPALLCTPCPGVQEGLVTCTCAFWKLFGSVRLPCICFSSVCFFLWGEVCAAGELHGGTAHALSCGGALGSVWALIWKLGERSHRFHHNNGG